MTREGGVQKYSAPGNLLGIGEISLGYPDCDAFSAGPRARYCLAALWRDEGAGPRSRRISSDVRLRSL